MDVFVSNPYAHVEFATETGQLSIFQEKLIKSSNMDLNIISINTNRDVGNSDCPTFSIQLIYKDDWYNSIGGNDLVKISLGRGSKEDSIFYGLVDNVQKDKVYNNLKPVRTINVTGRGFNKAFIQFGIGAVQEINFMFSSIGFFEGQQAGFSQGGPGKLIQIAVDYYINKGIDINFADGTSFKELMDASYEDTDEDQTLGNVMGYYSYQGGLWEYLKELRNAPFYEAFWEIENDKPTFIVRPTPFNKDNWESLDLIELEDREIVDEKLGRTDLENYTVFSVKGECLISAMESLYGYPIWYKPFYPKYGLRRLQVQSKYMKTSEIPQDNQMTFGEVKIEGGAGGEIAYPVPQDKFRITSPYGYRKAPIAGATNWHAGIDLGCPAGTSIYAVADGVVKQVTRDKWRGHFIDIDHLNGMMTRYQHCLERPIPPKGTQVKRGQIIAKVGSTGASTGPHLHFEVHINGNTVDPAKYYSSNKGSGGKGGPEDDREPIASLSPKLLREQERSKEFDDNYVEYLRTKKLGELMPNLNVFEQNKMNNLDPFLDSSLKDGLIKAVEEDIAEQNKNQGLGDSISVSQKTIDLFNWNIKNNIMENGSLVLVGDGRYKVGKRLKIKSTDMEYYIENVSHDFNVNDGWRSNLQVTRGLKEGTRFTEPWDCWERITPEDLEEISGMDATALSATQIQGDAGDNTFINSNYKGEVLRERIAKIAKSKQGLPYSQNKRMSDGYADCSSFVYKVAMEALGKSWKGTNAPTTNDKNMQSSIWYEVPLDQVKPWDILHRPGHTEFLGDDGKTYGAHDWNTPAGPGWKYKSKDWVRAYRLKGL